MHVCLFDIDGTLLSSGGAGRAAMETGLAVAFGVTAVLRVEYSGRTDRAIGRDLFLCHGLNDTADNWQKLITSYLQHLPGCLSKHEGRVLPGITSLLEHLQERGDVAVGLLTGNIREGARLKLGHYNLYHHFAFGGFGDQHDERDDVAREALAEVRRRFDDSVPSERIWIIGDTPLDIRCARCIGARVAAVGTGWHSLDELAAEKPDLLLADLSDPSPLLARF